MLNAQFKSAFSERVNTSEDFKHNRYMYSAGSLIPPIEDFEITTRGIKKLLKT